MATANNPTNIYLEIEGDRGESQLSLLVAQGQKFPYRTVLLGKLKLPPKETGHLGFKVWVGMGTKVGCNTSLQRLRSVPIEKIHEAKLQPGALLDLEVEYTFDERLLLTLVSQSNGKARFQLEVTSDQSQLLAQKGSPIITLEGLIPKIPRRRQQINSEISDLKVDFKQWELLAQHLEHNWQNASFHQQRHELVRQTSLAKNSITIITDLLHWLEMDALLSNSSSAMKVRLAVMSLPDILKTIPSDSPSIIPLERKFHQWVWQKFHLGFNQMPNELFSALVETPGKLFWSDFASILIERYKYHSQQAKAEVFFTSIGKCVKPSTTNLAFLRDVVQNTHHIGQKIRAAWALGRLISFGQPDDWKADFKEVQLATKVALQQLHHSSTTPQVAIQLLNCLSQCMTWHISGHHLSQELCQKIKSLPQAYLPVAKSFSQYPDISKLFERNLELILKLFNPIGISLEESKEIKMFLLQAVRD